MVSKHPVGTLGRMKDGVVFWSVCGRTDRFRVARLVYSERVIPKHEKKIISARWRRCGQTDDDGKEEENEKEAVLSLVGRSVHERVALHLPTPKSLRSSVSLELYEY